MKLTSNYNFNRQSQQIVNYGVSYNNFPKTKLKKKTSYLVERDYINTSKIASRYISTCTSS